MKDARLNVEMALKKLGGSHKLFKVLLVGFSLKYAKVDLEIRALSSAGCFEEAQRLAHSLKGLSGNLGAEKLRLCALKLEEVFKHEQNDYEIQLNDFSIELNAVIGEIKSLLEIYNQGYDEAAPTLALLDDTDLSIIHQLINALESFQGERISEAQVDFKRYIFADEEQEVACVINELIDVYEYNEARNQLDMLLKMISGDKDY
ncbi:MAG: hypothetical protein CVV02_15540 [Firmicutes bacterium HGW-Firmicutes-7]|nr:MAG: hypothetical protein CVV02_15540 [Firmicutes bacterium HGW-Firmicutes-7]